MEVAVQGDALVVTVPAEMAGAPCREVLRALSLPEGFIRRLFQDGAVRVGRAAAHPDDSLVPGQRVRIAGGVEEDEPLLERIPEGASGWPPVEVLFEDDHQLVVHKPAGVLVHPGGPEDSDTMAHRVAWYLQWQGLRRRARHVHRLDRDTTGALVYAKHAYAARALDQQLADGALTRVYWALAAGRLVPDSGVIDAPIGRDRHVAGRYRVSPGGKPARTEYATLVAVRQANGWVSLVECRLDSGRTHQIRVHLASRGCPVVGDVLYGGGPGAGAIRWPGGHALHARWVAFHHLYSGRRIEVEAPLPEAFATVLERLELWPR
ncbi:RluA family pseudouridine synthase [Alicyclobacillus macrosporangiidus]|jgi:23S rRNA pseudouridine1911/1915/1917 synthase|uniref:Pseudouridine synthase n=1 Tax=Alicyclobacillus macrosporangiidus TaxID=392015 RepID=A0A1I7FIB4_9BACL|nr:RluA family pseudouridine synthase [Alicyclobacillus macrosporangiidus]SFU35895.1 23S rRNA pseudouridine1911/1915/1917 synthase [Alicyclobacillus macrosporangiidus]